MKWIWLFVVSLNIILADAALSIYHSTSVQTWRDSRHNCTLVSKKILCDESWKVCEKELNISNTLPLAWIDGHVSRSPWYTYSSQNRGYFPFNKSMVRFNQKEIDSNCASVQQTGNTLIIENKPCQNELNFICDNGSEFEPHNKNSTWNDSRQFCERKNFSLTLRPEHLSKSTIQENQLYWIGFYRNEKIMWQKDFINTETSENTEDVLCLAVEENGANVQAVNCSLHLHGICVFRPTYVQSNLDMIVFPVSFGISVIIGLVLYLLCLILVLIFKRCRILSEVANENYVFKSISTTKELYFDPKLTEDNPDLPQFNISCSLSTFPMKSKTVSGLTRSKASTLPCQWGYSLTEYQSDPYLNRDPQPLPNQVGCKTIMVNSCSSLRDLSMEGNCINAKLSEVPCSSSVQKISDKITDKQDEFSSIESENDIICQDRVHRTCKPDVEQTPRFISNVVKSEDGYVKSPNLKRTSFIMRLNQVLKFTPQKAKNEVKSNIEPKTDCKYEKDQTDTIELKTCNQDMKMEDDYIQMHCPTRESNQESGYISMTEPRSTINVIVDDHGYSEVL